MFYRTHCHWITIFLGLLCASIVAGAGTRNNQPVEIVQISSASSDPQLRAPSGDADATDSSLSSSSTDSPADLRGRGRVIGKVSRPSRDLPNPQSSPSLPTMDDRLRRLAERFDPPPNDAKRHVHDRTETESSVSDQVTAAPDHGSSILPERQTIDAFEDRPLGPSKRNTEPSNQAEKSAPKRAWITQTAMALAAVVGLILLLRWVLSRISGRPIATNQHRTIEVLSRVSIAPRSHILLVRLGRRILVVGESPSGLHTLSDIQEAEEVADLLQSVSESKSTSSTHGFSQLMNLLNSEYSDHQRLAEEGADDGEGHVDRTRDQLSALTSRLRVWGTRGRVT